MMLNLIGSKVMTQKTKIQIAFFLQNRKKWEMEMFAFGAITFGPIEIRPIRDLKMNV